MKLFGGLDAIKNIVGLLGQGKFQQGLGAGVEEFTGNPVTSAIQKQMMPDDEKRQNLIGGITGATLAAVGAPAIVGGAGATATTVGAPAGAPAIVGGAGETAAAVGAPAGAPAIVGGAGETTGGFDFLGSLNKGTDAMESISGFKGAAGGLFGKGNQPQGEIPYAQVNEGMSNGPITNGIYDMLPQYANGGIVPGGLKYIVDPETGQTSTMNELGPEAIVPLSTRNITVNPDMGAQGRGGSIIPDIIPVAGKANMVEKGVKKIEPVQNTKESISARAAKAVGGEDKDASAVEDKKNGSFDYGGAVKGLARMVGYYNDMRKRELGAPGRSAITEFLDWSDKMELANKEANAKKGQKEFKTYTEGDKSGWGSYDPITGEFTKGGEGTKSKGSGDLDDDFWQFDKSMRDSVKEIMKLDKTVEEKEAMVNATNSRYKGTKHEGKVEKLLNDAMEGQYDDAIRDLETKKTKNWLGKQSKGKQEKLESKAAEQLAATANIGNADPKEALAFLKKNHPDRYYALIKEVKI